MKKREYSINILEGKIASGLLWLALPIMATSFLEMAYNLVDMFWVGGLGSDAVAAIGTAGFFPWLMQGLITIPRIGAEVMVSQAIGKGKEEDRKGYLVTTVQMGFLMGIAFSIFLSFQKEWLLAFFHIQEAHVVAMSADYLAILVFGLPFAFLNPIFTGILNAHGKSRIPFRFNTTGLITNMILDPILIFGWFGLPALGVRGAAYATVISHMIVSLGFLQFMIRDSVDFSGLSFGEWSGERWRKVLRLGLPSALQSILFTLFSMVLARIVTAWGAAAIAVQKVTAQIEAISWRSAQGFGAALTTYVGQNFGAGKSDRVKQSYRSALGMGGVIGFLAGVLLFLFPEQLLSPFFYEPEVLQMGVSCMRIMSVSQLAMSLEIITAGGFNGLGRTLPPSVSGIVFTGMRIPMALLFSGYMGLDGVWWSMTVSSILKGSVLPAYYYLSAYRKLGQTN